jgi:hypothetical protein
MSMGPVVSGQLCAITNGIAKTKGRNLVNRIIQFILYKEI